MPGTLLLRKRCSPNYPLVLASLLKKKAPFFVFFLITDTNNVLDFQLEARPTILLYFAVNILLQLPAAERESYFPKSPVLSSKIQSKAHLRLDVLHENICD